MEQAVVSRTSKLASPVVILAGGGVKTAVAAAVAGQGQKLTLFHVDFGQAAAQAERTALHELAGTLPSTKVFGVELPHVGQLQGVASGNSAPGDDRIATSGADYFGLLPMLLSAGMQCAQRVGAASLVTGLSRFCDAAHLGLFGAGGRTACLPEFIHSFNVMIDSLYPRGSRVAIDAPLMDIDYPDAVRLGRHLNAPIDTTWSCTQRGPRPCGQCEPCNTRAKALEPDATPVVAGAAAP